MSAEIFAWPGRINGNSDHDLIAAYLAIDIQRSPEWAEELVEKTAGVKSGQIDSWERCGNAYCLRLFRDEVEIEENYEEQPAKPIRIPIDDFEAAAVAWRKFIGQPRNK